MRKVPLSFADQRGTIHNLLNEPCGGVQLIYSRAGSKRSSHWHKEDSHWLYVLSGQVEYWEREVGSTEPPRRKLVLPGEMVFTGPRVEHWCRFPVDTEMVCMSNRARTHEEHELDLVRVKWWDE